MICNLLSHMTGAPNGSDKYVLTVTGRMQYKVNIFKLVLNSEFFFSLAGCRSKAKAPNLFIAGGRTDGFMLFLEGISVK